ncbi:hypothetical protein GCM10011609_86200 [Lentzea pudingi]|uniref:N-acetyltransferase domain-containing protein n=1 Tax=Lentzea pudingi TaxID=1789439 RepID=A0ABQ2IW38_9PSEU|nr:GNAT family N-acetyltransferase [Lentzea pudingi]GGN29288.1 hypothetical protein GCM10011609_86200 [Lentzea pudingi]
MGGKTAVELTERKLLNGWASAPRVRIRQAGVNDLDHFEWITDMAGAPFEKPLREAVAEGLAGVGLRAGLRAGNYRAYWEQMAPRFPGLIKQGLSPLMAYMDAALVLVADHRDHGVVGGLIAYPPVNVAESYIGILEANGATSETLQKTVLGMGMFLTRIKAIAVSEQARGSTVGSSLIKRARQIYFHLGYRTIYGAMPPTPGLEQFYNRAGFTVLDPDEPVDLRFMFDDDRKIFPDAGERFFVRHNSLQ